MFAAIEGALRDYAWGSRTAIADLTGRPASGGPEAELWFGAHPAAPSTGTAATPATAGRPLDAIVADDPARLLGSGRTRLPFLLKILAADRPLSLQVHPDAAQAEAGFAREEEAGTAIDAPDRDYRDSSAKPELILAVSPTFEALAGFRHVSETRMLFAELAMSAAGDDAAAIRAVADRLGGGDPALAGSAGSAAHVVDDGVPEVGATSPQHDGAGNPLAQTVEWLLRGGPDVDAAVSAVTSAASRASANSSFGREWADITRLANDYPGDPGVVVALLLNRISLRQGEALSIPAGVLHAYLEGVGIELMAASDNVLRGGLTGKHVDVDELLRIVRFEAVPAPVVRAEEPADGLTMFRPSEGDFVLDRVAVGDAGAVHGYRLTGADRVRVPLTGPAIVLCLTGGLRATGGTGSIDLARGDAAFASADEGALVITGSATAVVATTA